MTNAVTPAALAERIRRSGLSPRYIARQLRMSENTLLKVASGSVRVTFVTLDKISSWLSDHERTSGDRAA